jgi:hypothetical protein
MPFARHSPRPRPERAFKQRRRSFATDDRRIAAGIFPLVTYLPKRPALPLVKRHERRGLAAFSLSDWLATPIGSLALLILLAGQARLEHFATIRP